MHMKSTFSVYRMMLAVVLILYLRPATFAQGTLTPPDAPAPTMKTLDQIEPRVPLNSLPANGNALFTISLPGSYYLTTNVVIGAGVNAIAVLTNDVVIDLNGFTLFGTSSRVAIHTFGVNIGRIRIVHGQLSAGPAALISFLTGRRPI